MAASLFKKLTVGDRQCVIDIAIQEYGCYEGVFILMKVRKKDWKKHWEDMEAEHNVGEARRKPSPPPDAPPEA